MDDSAAPSPREDGLVLVFGASGYIGTNLVPALLAAGRRVRASARNRAVLEGRGWEGVELVEADALRPETLPAALAGVEVAYYLVHSMGAGPGFPALEREAAEGFGRAAETAGPARAGTQRALPGFPRAVNRAIKYTVINTQERVMAAVTANDLKTRGVSALEEALSKADQAVISVRGMPRYVALRIEDYDRLREAEIYAAWQEARADVEAGRYATETVDAHMARLEEELAEKSGR